MKRSEEVGWCLKMVPEQGDTLESEMEGGRFWKEQMLIVSVDEIGDIWGY